MQHGNKDLMDVLMEPIIGGLHPLSSLLLLPSWSSAAI